MTRRFALVAALLLMTGCASRAVYSSPDVGMVELEALISAEVRADSLVIRVRSRGCTSKADMAFFVERAGNRAAVAFGRKRLETCQGQPSPLELVFSYSELGLKPGQSVAIVNPLSAGN
jgi:predicted secreted protein